MTVPSLLSLCTDKLVQFVEDDPNLLLDYIPSLNLPPIVFEKMGYVTLERFRQEKIKHLSIEVINARISEREKRYRILFAQKPFHEEIQNPYLMLINVFERSEIFIHNDGDNYEKEIPKLFPISERRTGSAITTKEQFLKNFNVFSCGQLAGIDWSNIFVAGGSVLACLQPLPSNVNLNSNSEIRDYFLDGTTYFRKDRRKRVEVAESRKPKFLSSDIDIFIYGLSVQEAIKKIESIYNIIKENNFNKVLIVRTPQAVTFVSQFPYRHIQIVLRLYKSPAEILMGFDIDSCCVGFDGKSVWCLPRFHRAITRQVNYVDLSRYSTTYESRLLKYSNRGFEVAVPGLKMDKVNPKIFEPLFVASGLALLLRWNRMINDTEFWRLMRPNSRRVYWGWKEASTIRRNEYLFSNTDYSNVFLPWGYRWNAERIENELRRRRNKSESYYSYYKKSAVSCSFGFNISHVLFSCDNPLPEENDRWNDYETTEVLNFLPNMVRFLTEEPGRQYIGSMHPKSAEDWEKDVYINQ